MILTLPYWSQESRQIPFVVSGYHNREGVYHGAVVPLVSVDRAYAEMDDTWCIPESFIPTKFKFRKLVKTRK